jgi:hypothetical protein
VCSLVSQTREINRPRVSVNKTLRRICGPKIKEGKGEKRKIHNTELNDTCPLANINVVT